MLRLYRGGGKRNQLTERSHILKRDRLGNAGRDNAGVETE